MRARKSTQRSPHREALERQRSALTDKLRTMFDEVAAEPLPQSFEDLLALLEDDAPKGSDRYD
jgi:hypothetical protein